MNACVPNSSPEQRFFFLLLPASPTLASLKAPRCPRRAWHSLPAPRGRPGTVASARQVPARRARKSLASLAHAFGANCFGPQFLRPFQIREATDETVGRGGMANGLGVGGTAVPVCGGESRLEPRPPALSLSPSPRTVIHFHDPSLPQARPTDWWGSAGRMGVPGYLEARTIHVLASRCALRCGEDWLPVALPAPPELLLALVHLRPQTRCVPAQCWHTCYCALKGGLLEPWSFGRVP